MGPGRGRPRPRAVVRPGPPQVHLGHPADQSVQGRQRPDLRLRRRHHLEMGQATMNKAHTPDHMQQKYSLPTFNKYYSRLLNKRHMTLILFSTKIPL